MTSAPGEKIAFVGLGVMGWPMAACLIKAGFALNVVDATPGRAAAFGREVGGEAYDTATSAVQDVGTLILILPTSSEVRHVIEQVRRELRASTLVIDMTSGSPAVTRELAAELEALGHTLIDAPVSGGAVRAKTGELTIMIGATDEAFARATPALETMGTSLHHVGQVGAGQTAKAMNNLVYSAGILIAVEALLIGQRAGVDPAKIVDVMNASSGGNGATRLMIKNQILSRAFKPAFKLDLMLKDLTIATELARETRTTAPFSQICRETWSAAAALLGPGLDNSAIAQFCERITGDTLSSPSVEQANAE